MIEKVKKNRLFIIIIIIFLIFLGYARFEFRANNRDNFVGFSLSGNDNLSSNKVEEITQSFIATNDNLYKVSILFDNNSKLANNETFVIGIRESDGKVIQKTRITSEMLYDLNKINNGYTFVLKPIKNSKDNEYVVFIDYSNLTENSNVILKTFTDFSNTNYELYVNGEKSSGNLDLTVRYFCYKKEIVFWFISVLLLLISFLVTRYIINKNLSIEKTFMIVGGLLFILYIIFMPPIASHDEMFHWSRAYEISEGTFITKIKDGHSSSILPFGTSSIFKDVYERRYQDTIDDLSIKLDYNNRIPVYIESVAVYSPVQYIPQALGIAVSRLFTDRPIIMAYSGILFNAVCCFILLYITLKILPVGKLLFMTCMLIPIALEGFTSLSPDGLTISVSFLFTAYILKLIFDKERIMNRRDYIIILILGFFLSMCKMVYVPLFGLVLLIPVKKVGTVKQYILKMLPLILVTGFFALLWLKIASSHLALYKMGIPSLKMQFIISNPINFFETIISTIDQEGLKYFVGLFGGNIGWYETVKSNVLIPLGFAILCFVSVVYDINIRKLFRKQQKVYILFLIFGVVLLIFTSLYIQATSLYNESSIWGVQGRYFLPFLPISFLVIGNLNLKFSKKFSYIKFVASAICVLSIFMVLKIFIFFI